MIVSAPDHNQIEISVIGPGYGESILIHIGSGRWIVIDSCINSHDKSPAAPSYLTTLGLDPAECVHLIVTTHWHDDHIRGLSALVRACKSAKFCLAAALTTQEFLETLASYDEAHGLVSGSGASEIMSTLQIVRDEGRRAARVVADTRLYQCPGTDLAHGQSCEIWGLSPSAKQFDLSLRAIGNLMPQPTEAKRRAPEQGRNDLSIAAWISIGDLAILLGADLEERNDPELGWTAIISSSSRPPGKASFFKIPHHGSFNGHCGAVWDDLLVSRPTTVLTPWNRGRGLPLQSDIERIRSHSDAAFATTTFKANPVRRRVPAVEKQLREVGVKIKSDVLRTGHVRLRNGGTKNANTWCVEMLEGSCHLDTLIAA
ncbi:MBL fold metallo-hydrolase [Methylobacterium sp. E-046]|uniref:MBL fold metallo-hydrolase n=1 Tax=Methylobacterium sp. E-046 TaxID=2836576 RepID=UPI00391C53EB